MVFLFCIYSALDEPEDGEQTDIAEMPIDLDIEVVSVGLDDNEIEQLRQDTRQVYKLRLLLYFAHLHVIVIRQ